MKKEIILEGKIEIEIEEIENYRNYMKCFLIYVNGIKLPRVELNIKDKKIHWQLFTFIENLLDIKPDDYNSYIEFFEKQGFKINLKKIHWEPEKYEKYYYCDNCNNKIEELENEKSKLDEDLISNYLAFPTYKLTDKCKNMSKLDRLQVLYQYNDNIMFEPDWEDEEETKYYLYVFNGNIKIDFVWLDKANNVYWKRYEDLEEFIQLYKEEIKELMDC